MSKIIPDYLVPDPLPLEEETTTYVKLKRSGRKFRVRNILKATRICLRKVEKHHYNVKDKSCLQYKYDWKSYYIWYHNIYTIINMIGCSELGYDKSHIVAKLSNPELSYLHGLEKG